MNGIYVEQHISNGDCFWVAKDPETNRMLSIGVTIKDAVESYEVALENKKMEKELGLNLDDLNI